MYLLLACRRVGDASTRQHAGVAGTSSASGHEECHELAHPRHSKGINHKVNANCVA